MTSIQTTMDQSPDAKLESQMELTYALIAKIQFRDEQQIFFTEHVGIESQFEIWVEDDEIEEKN